jgi:subtilase family serine protease
MISQGSRVPGIAPPYGAVLAITEPIADAGGIPVTIPWIRLISAAGLVLVLIMIPAAAADCPGTCACLGASEAKDGGYTTLCGGKQIICGYESTLKAQIPKYCYEKPVVTTTTPSIVKCPSGCTCLAVADAKAKGYSACPLEKNPCGYDNLQNFRYCFAVPAVTTATPVPVTGTPDLVIDDVYTEAWPSYREFRYIIRNRGNGVAAPSTTRLFIDGVQVGEDAVAALNPGESRVRQVSYSGTCSGSADLFGAVADSTGAVAESDESNNARQREYACPAVTVVPDLELLEIWHEGERNFTYSTRAYTPLENIRFRMRSRNTSGALSTEARLFIHGTWVSTTTATAATPRDGGWEGQFGYIGICSGTSDTVRVVIDPADTLIEQDESNNALSVTWNCAVSPSPDSRPDLIIRRVWLTPMGDYQYKIGYEIKNQGKEYTPVTGTGLFIDGVYRVQDGVDRLAPGESRDEEFGWNYSMRDCSGSSDTLRIGADHDGRVTEMDETNNDYEMPVTCTAVPVSVTPKPDLVISSVWYECTPPCHEYTVKYTLRNQGTALAGASVTGLNINYRELGTSSAPALASGAASTQTFSTPWAPAYPENTVRICADRGNAVDEITPAPSGELNNCLEVTWSFTFTCDNNVQDRDETGTDCGGSYCPPCAACSTGAKWAPSDTPCSHAWPTSDGPTIGMNTESDSCDLIEVCDPELDYIIRDAITCAEHADYAARYTGSRAAEKICACGLARAESGIDTNYNPTTYKRALAHYVIHGLGSCHTYMQGYFHGEWCCYGDDKICPDTCSYWRVNPPAWEMGTGTGCDPSPSARPDFGMGGHRCEYYDAWIFGKYGKAGYWNSDTSYRSNSDSVVDVPAHASINRLSTGTCVDYSFALATLLRKIGYSKDDVFSVNGEGHGYNLLRFPGETKFHYVDTVGNRGGEIFGGTGFPAIYNATGHAVAWYNYCTRMDEGCSNDYYSQSTSRCPSNNNIYSCEGRV